MVNKLRNYIDDLFENVPKTKKIKELKDELSANLIEKYNDLLVEGKSEEDSYNIVIAGIGDVSELIEQVRDNSCNKSLQEKECKRSAKLLAIAVMLYIISVIPVVLLGSLGLGEIGIVLMFLCIGSATGLIVYRNASTPDYLKADETLIEEFKEWKSKKRNKSSLKNAINTALWPLTVAIYLVVNIFFGIWSISWLIFIIAYAIENLIEAVFEYKEGKE